MILPKKLTSSHETRDVSRNPNYQIRLERQARALLRAQAKGKYLDNNQKRLINRWQHLNRKSRVGEVA